MGRSGGKARLAWWVGACALATVVALVSILLGNHRRDDPSLDVLDEWAHYAYVVDLQHHHIPAWGDPQNQPALRLFECLGNGFYKPGECDGRTRQASRFPTGGYSYEAQQPPLGYLPYALTAEPGAAPPAALAAAREGGRIWTVAAAVLLLAVAAVEGLPLIALLVLEATCLLSPIHVHAAATVNNDAAGVAAGALALLVAAAVRGLRRPVLGFAIGLGAGVVIGMLKGVFVVAPLALVLAGLLTERPWSLSAAAARDALRRNAGLLGMLAGAAGSYLGWIVWQDARAKVSSSIVLHLLLDATRTDHLHPSSMVRGLAALMSLLVPYSPDAPVHHIWNIAFLGAVVAVVVLRTRSDVTWGTRALAGATVVAMVTLAAGWPVVNYVQGHWDLHAETRYALPLLPVLAMVVVRSAERFGMLLLGLVLPASAAWWQLATATV